MSRDIAVVGASAGGLDALRTLLASLPSDYAAAMFIVFHMAAESPGSLAVILQRATTLPVRAAEDGAPVVPGEIRVGVPNRHLVLEGGRIRLSSGPRENRHRPAIDSLFRSAAFTHDTRVVGIVLTGMLDDGAAGLWSIKAHGGHAIVQDPADATFPDMPQNAIDAVDVDQVLRLPDIAPALARLAQERVGVATPTRDLNLELEVEMMANDDFSMEKLDRLGDPSKLTCPECGGALWEMREPPTRFRCHVGHGYSMHNLFAEQNTQVEASLWAAVRALDEAAHIARRLADQAQRSNRPKSARTFRDQAEDSARHATRIRSLIERGPATAAS